MSQNVSLVEAELALKRAAVIASKDSRYLPVFERMEKVVEEVHAQDAEKSSALRRAEALRLELILEERPEFRELFA